MKERTVDEMMAQVGEEITQLGELVDDLPVDLDDVTDEDYLSLREGVQRLRAFVANPTVPIPIGASGTGNAAVMGDGEQDNIVSISDRGPKV